MIIKINAIEVASDLAHQALLTEVSNESYAGNVISHEDDVYEEVSEKDFSYKEEYQNIFNDHYDYFFEMITNKMLENE